MNVQQYYRVPKMASAPTVLPFISTWRTTNTSTGSSTSTQVKLPLLSTGSYDFIVDWGDGNSDVITAWNQLETTHTYLSAGDYIIKITGTCRGWAFSGNGDRLKIIDISQWGDLRFLNVSIANNGCFRGCANLAISATDSPDFTGITSINGFFYQCTNFTGASSMNDWDVSGITDMAFIFHSTNFNANINDWDVSNVQSFSGAFVNTPFNQPLNNWNVSSGVNFSAMFQGSSFNQNIGSWNMISATNISAMFRLSSFNNGGSPDINNWNTSNIILMGGSNAGCFASCPFNQPIGNWDTSNVTTFLGMFLSNTVFNQNIGSWDVSSCTNFGFMFATCTSFNNGGSSSIGGWNVSSGVSFSAMFQGSSFNQNIGSWNMISATNISAMFRLSSFNNGGSPDINNWNTSNIILMGGSNAGCFASCPFNQPIGNWDVSKCVNFEEMFFNATSFNQDISGWNTALATNMVQMFNNASAFNQNIGGWNVGNVTTMVLMFANAIAFNQNLGGWNVVKVTTMESMFQGCTGLTLTVETITNTWVTTALTTSNSMFSGCTALTGNGNYFISKPKAAGYTVGTGSTTGSYRTFFNCSALTDFATIPADYK